MTDAAENPTTREEIEALHRPDAWTPDQLLARLEALGLDIQTEEHAPMWTVEDSQRLRADMSEDGHCKSLFLRNKKGSMWLVVMLEDQRLDIKALGVALGEKLSFAKPDRLMEYLGVIPGSVTPFSVVNDSGKAVQVVLQRRMMECAHLHYHPLRNFLTTRISSGDLVTFLEAQDHPPHILEF